MPYSVTEQTALKADVQSLSTLIDALVVDGVNPLQAQLDAANATIATRDATIVTMQAAIDSAQAAMIAH